MRGRLMARLYLGVPSAVLVLACAPVARAQDSADLETVQVTAQKIPQALGQTPVSVALISGDALDARAILSPTELPLVSPSLTFTSAINSRSQGLNIRGIGTQSYSDGVESSVSTVVDGVVLARQMMSLFALADVDRIEILRGPQGVLFGKNASAGVIDIHTKDPSPSPDVEAKVSYGSLDEMRGAVTLSGPVAGDAVTGRLTLSGVRSDGFIHNLYDGRDYNDEKDSGARLKLAAAPAPGLKLNLALDYARSNTNCCVMTVRSTAPGAYFKQPYSSLIGVAPGANSETADFNTPYQLDQWTEGAALTAVQNLGDFSLTSISAVRRFHEFDNNDRDLTPDPIFSINSSDEREDQTSEELRLASRADAPVSLMAGYFLFNQKLLSHTASQGDFSGLLPLVSQGNLVSRGVSSLSQSAFGEAIWHVTGQLNLTLGLRYTDEDSRAYFLRSLYPGASAPAPSSIGGPPLVAPALSSHDAKISDRISLDYHLTPEVMTYVSWSRGFKGAGLNLLNFVTAAQIASGPYRVAPETSASFETGLRGAFLRGGLDLDLTLFNETFHGFQTTAFDAALNSNILTSAGALRSRGVEIESEAHLARELSLNGSLAYTDAAYTNFSGAPCYPGERLAAGSRCALTQGNYTQNLSGRPLNNAPRWAFNLGPALRHPIGGGIEIFAEAAASFTGRYNFSANLDPNTIQKSHTVVDLSGGAAFQHRYRVRVFVRNLFDRKYAAAILPDLQSGSPTTAAGYAQIMPMDARRLMGIEVSGRF